MQVVRCSILAASMTTSTAHARLAVTRRFKSIELPALFPSNPYIVKIVAVQRSFHSQYGRCSGLMV